MLHKEEDMIKIRGVVVNTTEMGSGFVSTLDEEIAFVPIRVMNTSKAEVGDVVTAIAVKNFEEQKGKAKYRVIRLDVVKQAYSSTSCMAGTGFINSIDTFKEIEKLEPANDDVGIGSIPLDPNKITTAELNETVARFVASSDHPFLAREALSYFMNEYGIEGYDMKTSTRVNSALQYMHDRGEVPCAKLYKGGSISVASSVYFAKDISILKEYLTTKFD